ncbi:MAG: S1C family serine protease, partial [Planctomycetota bacterium]
MFSAEDAAPTSDPAAAAWGAPRGVADLKAMERQIGSVVEKVRASTVSVDGASGVVVSEDGHVLTVAHLARRAGRNVVVTFPNGRKVKGKTLGNDHGVDAGMIEITEEGPWPFVELGSSSQLREGQWCLTLGYPVTFQRGIHPPARIGRILRRSPALIITDCPIMGGDSGGPLFNLEGKVVGIGSRCDDSLRINLYVPVDAYRDSWDRLARGEDFNSRAAYLGIVRDRDADGVTVGSVVPGSPAEKAGFEAGDTLLKIDGAQLNGFFDLIRLMRQKEPGAEVEIEVRRGEDTLKLAVTLGKRDESSRFRSVHSKGPVGGIQTGAATGGFQDGRGFPCRAAEEGSSGGGSDEKSQAPGVDRGTEEPEPSRPGRRYRRRRGMTFAAKDTRDAAKSAFREVTGPASAATVRILAEDKPLALGAVVDSDGYVVTKASLLPEEGMTCRLPDGREVAADRVGVDQDNDLALLKVDAEQLTPVPWRSGDAPVGSWIAAVGRQREPLAVGIISVEPRGIGGARRAPSQRGVLGVTLIQAGGGPKIDGIREDSAAAKAGLEIGDVIAKIDGRTVRTV